MQLIIAENRGPDPLSENNGGGGALAPVAPLVPMPVLHNGQCLAKSTLLLLTIVWCRPDING